eukprot:TRINITY_DN18460_c0_g1_i1.p1 TRINITY_DN18460_c0_g1~~TRINITY_DN18460_c0_g1_i1.p1  ORF type:complete len:264 (-),score=60.88 TRINITY_DN18460_c0_g1_i1:126-917(-)
MSAQDPYYLVKDEIQDSVEKASARFQQYEQQGAAGGGSGGERDRQRKDLMAECDSIEWQLEELDRAIGVAERAPERFGVDKAEIDQRRSWTSEARRQVAHLKRSLHLSEVSRREFTRLPAQSSSAANVNGAIERYSSGAAAASGMPMSSRADSNATHENDDYISSEDDHQALLIRHQDEHLDMMSRSLANIGSMGLSIHEELDTQDKIISELHDDLDTTNSRLAVVQKKMQILLKKAGIKGQLCILGGLFLLLLILIVLVVYS